ncbi:hypothetical protein [Flavobacterium psychraquaticum]|uniref:hypothetical protein n=1 Tax=Flavobacterium psychraquaticum TaxID=3103958 RepID=UPI002ACD5EED|nr:hypothetical protein [Flavobacterium sp. LB-N7T]
MKTKNTIVILIGILSFFGCKPEVHKSISENLKNDMVPKNINYEKQIEIFKSLGYEFTEGVTKEMILTDGYAESSWEEIKIEQLKKIEANPFSLLYYYFGWRSPEIKNYNFSNKCIWFDLEFIDPSDQYIWFMERMGIITNEELNFTDITIEVDKNNFEWIVFKVNGIDKRWKLEKVGYISDSFFQRFSYLPAEFKTKRRYTYYSDGGQQFVIDFATEIEQQEFIKSTNLKREWLGEGNHFSEPK